MKSMVALSCSWLLAILATPQGHGDEPATDQFQTIPFIKLVPKIIPNDVKLVPKAVEPKEAAKEVAMMIWRWEAALVEALNSSGAEGWEVTLSSKYAFLLRKGKVAQKWEYKLVRASQSPLVGQVGEEEALSLILERLAVQGW